MSDIHGNLVALEAVLSDINMLGGVDRLWAIGDHVALGPEPTVTPDRATPSLTRPSGDSGEARWIVTNRCAGSIRSACGVLGTNLLSSFTQGVCRRSTK